MFYVIVTHLIWLNMLYDCIIMTIYAIRLYVFNLTMGHDGLVIRVHILFVNKSSSSLLIVCYAVRFDNIFKLHFKMDVFLAFISHFMLFVSEWHFCIVIYLRKQIDQYMFMQ